MKYSRFRAYIFILYHLSLAEVLNGHYRRLLSISWRFRRSLGAPSLFYSFFTLLFQSVNRFNDVMFFPIHINFFWFLVESFPYVPNGFPCQFLGIYLPRSPIFLDLRPLLVFYSNIRRPIRFFMHSPIVFRIDFILFILQYTCSFGPLSANEICSRPSPTLWLESPSVFLMSAFSIVHSSTP